MCEHYQLIKDRAILLLSRREHSKKELTEKLVQKLSINKLDILGVLNELEQKDYLSDNRYADMVIRSQFKRGYGPIKIQSALKQKGVHVPIADISRLCSEPINWTDAIRSRLVKMYNDSTKLSIEEKAIAYRKLLSRGFFSDDINQCLTQWPD